VETSQRVVDVLLGALAQALPGEVPAASYGTMTNLTIGSVPTSAGRYSYYETIAGGTGGHPRGPGSSGTQAHMTNTMNTPIESLEHAYPLRVRRYSIRRGSGGAGLHRGGDGLVREIEVLEDATVTLLADRRRNAPWGLAGGRPGKRGDDRLRRDDAARHVPSKSRLEVKAGDSIELRTPGGGGWGKSGKRRGK